MSPLPSFSPSGTAARLDGWTMADLEKGYGEMVVEGDLVVDATVAYVRVAHVRRGLKDNMVVRRRSAFAQALMVARSKHKRRLLSGFGAAVSR